MPSGTVKRDLPMILDIVTLSVSTVDNGQQSSAHRPTDPPLTTAMLCEAHRLAMTIRTLFQALSKCFVIASEAKRNAELQDTFKHKIASHLSPLGREMLRQVAMECGGLPSSDAQHGDGDEARKDSGQAQGANEKQLLLSLQRHVQQWEGTISKAVNAVRNVFATSMLETKGYHFHFRFLPFEGSNERSMFLAEITLRSYNQADSHDMLNTRFRKIAKEVEDEMRMRQMIFAKQPSSGHDEGERNRMVQCFLDGAKQSHAAYEGEEEDVFVAVGRALSLPISSDEQRQKTTTPAVEPIVFGCEDFGVNIRNEIESLAAAEGSRRTEDKRHLLCMPNLAKKAMFVASCCDDDRGTVKRPRDDNVGPNDVENLLRHGPVLRQRSEGVVATYYLTRRGVCLLGGPLPFSNHAQGPVATSVPVPDAVVDCRIAEGNDAPPPPSNSMIVKCSGDGLLGRILLPQ